MPADGVITTSCAAGTLTFAAACASARANGCAATASSAAACASTSALRRPRNGITRVRAGSAVVSVPVLSQARMSMRASASSAALRAVSTPRSASADCVAASAAGAANESAHGQVATSTATAAGRACDGSTHPQPITVATVTPSTSQRNTTAMRLASSTMRGRSRPASSTRRRSAASDVASPARVTRTTSGCSRLTLPASTGEPSCFSIGVASPVSQACDTDEVPCTISPSAGTVSPTGTST